MAFDCRSDSYTNTWFWGSGRCRLTTQSLSSVDGGPASIPLVRGRPSLYGYDATLDVFVSQKLQLAVWEAATVQGAGPPATVVVGEMDQTRSSFQSEHRLVILRGFAGVHPASPVCCTVMADLDTAGVPHHVPRETLRVLRGKLAAFCHGAAARAVFLGHEAIRMSVNVELMGILPYDGGNPFHCLVAKAWTPCKPAAAFDICAARQAPGTCGGCGNDVAVGSRIEESPCGHSFHPACIDSGACPVCNSMIRKFDMRLSMFLSCPKPPPFS